MFLCCLQKYAIPFVSCLLLLRVNYHNKGMLENLNENLHQSFGIRYVSYPLVLDLFISLVYWNGLIFGVIQSVVVYPKP